MKVLFMKVQFKNSQLRRFCDNVNEVYEMQVSTNLAFEREKEFLHPVEKRKKDLHLQGIREITRSCISNHSNFCILPLASNLMY